jgi:pimeloyl-ACP methyl ester carboxylesterase
MDARDHDRRDAVPVAPTDEPGPGGSARQPHLDNLRTILVAWVIGGHALLGYSAVGGWAYDEVHEVTYSPRVELALLAVLGPSGLFVIGLFFSIAGLLTERAVTRHGPWRYVAVRARQLGLPWLVSVLLLWPLSLWLVYRLAGRPETPAWVMFHRDPPLDSGALWFALVLLLYSVAFAVWRSLAGRPSPVVGPLTGTGLGLAIVLIAVASFVVRLGFPARSGQPGDLHLWQWPQCLGMFVLGIVAARHGWDRRVPARLWRRCGLVTLVTVVALPVLALATGLHDVARQAGPYLGGWHGESLALATAEAVLVVCGTVFLIGGAERRLARSGPRATRWSGAAFAAFVIQGPVLLALAAAARPLPAPAEVKAPLVAAGGIAACFWLGRLLPTDRWFGRARGARPPTAPPGPSGSEHVDLGSRVHYVDFGGARDGPDIVLVHGLGGSHLNWDLLAPLLGMRGRVLAVDLPGFGLSSPTGRPATLRSNLVVLDRFIRRVCDAPVVLVGNSMGGLVSVLLAARSPELVRALVLLDPALPAPGHVLRSPAAAATVACHALPGVGEWLRRSRRRRIGAAATVHETLRLTGVDPQALPPDLLARSVALVEGQEDVTGADRAFLSAARSLAWALARSGRYRAAMAEVRAPVLLVHGDRDELVPIAAARAAARAHPDWDFLELPDVGHVPQLQVPTELAGHLTRWLDHVGATPAGTGPAPTTTHGEPPVTPA